MKKKNVKLISYEELMREQQAEEIGESKTEESRQLILNILLFGIIFICISLMVLENFEGRTFISALIATGMSMYMIKWNNEKEIR